MEKATFAAGCFWGIEASFRALKGVKETRVGYTGGSLRNPSYEEVCTGTTGHAEAVEVLFDPSEISYQDLLAVFWKIHDPTTLNRQGPDIGDQYRSAVFYHSPEQKKILEASLAEIEKKHLFSRPVVTQVVPVETFYAAEDYHQRYLEKQGRFRCH